MKLPEPIKIDKDLYRAQIRLGGKSHYVYGRTSAECKKKTSLLKSQWLNGTHGIEVRDEITLRQACEQYIRKKELARKSPETIRGYDIITRNRFQSVMDKPVKSVKNWQAAYDEDAGTCSPKTMKNAWAFIKSAVKSECGVTLPEIETVALRRTEHTFLSPEEIPLFIKAAEQDKYKIALYLALCSCRVSEIIALDWANVNLKKSTVKISGAVVRGKDNKPVAKAENKTDAGTRTIPIIIPELKTALEQSPQKSGRVIVANENTLLAHSNAVCDAAGLPRVGMHGLRHSFASLCYSLDIPVKITMQIGGWSDLKTMMDIYTHLSNNDINKHTEKLVDFFKPKNFA